MSCAPAIASSGRLCALLTAAWLLAGWLLAPPAVHAQPEPAPPAATAPEIFPAEFYARPTTDRWPSPAIVDSEVRQASGCCGMPPRSDAPSCGCGSNGSHCVPGRHCTGCDCGDTLCGRILNGLYDNLCCPDPCYEPRWIPAANAAFFQDGPRPVTMTRIRWDSVFNYAFPDSAEFFWAQIALKGPKNAAASLHYNELTLYQEVAAKGASMFVEIPYLSVLQDFNPSAAGFGDMNIGAKTVLLDRELLLVATQFRTYIPMGATIKGLGTGHVSLEPAVLAALKLTPSTYMQMELAYWIPIAGDPNFAGSTIHYHLSLNQNLCHLGDCFNMVATMEFNGFSYRGQYTAFPSGAHLDLAGSGFYSAGPGLRVQFCEQVDVGVGAVFGFGNGHGPDQTYRTELRLRF
jgi:hypothetical protein